MTIEHTSVQWKNEYPSDNGSPDHDAGPLWIDGEQATDAERDQFWPVWFMRYQAASIAKLLGKEFKEI